MMNIKCYWQKADCQLPRDVVGLCGGGQGRQEKNILQRCLMFTVKIENKGIKDVKVGDVMKTELRHVSLAGKAFQEKDMNSEKP